MKLRNVPESRPCRPWSVRPIVLAVVLAMSAQAMAQSSGGIGGLFKGAQDAAAQAIQAMKQGQQQAASAPALAMPALPPAKLQASYTSLFDKGTVNGKDLYDTLKAIRQQARERKSAEAWSAFSVATDATMSSIQAGKMPTLDTFTNAGLKLLMEWAKSQATEVGMKALDDHLQYLLDDRDNALSKETITLPARSTVQSEAQASRIITMAALVVAARISSNVLDKAKGDFASLQDDFGKLLERREKAAGLLFTAIDVRRKAQRGSDAAALTSSEAPLKSALRSEDIAFIDNDIGRLSVADFSKDMAAQNLALKYLAQQDPATYKDYQVQASDYVARSRAYLRTMSGVAAFGGLLLTFGQTVTEIGKEKNIDNIMQALPLGLDFLKAAGPTAQLAVETALEGVVMQPVLNPLQRLTNPPKNFSLVLGDQSPTKVAGAKEVFAALKKQENVEADKLLQGALFSSDVRGFLAGVRSCDAAEAGRMLDAAVAKDKREKFATEYFGNDKRSDGFSFLNAFEARDAAGDKLASEILSNDLRERIPPVIGLKRGTALSEMQKEVSAKYVNWGDEQLTRLIFANREGDVVHATMQLGSVAVRPVPTMESVYVYESQADACRKTNDREAGVEDVPAPTKKSKKTT